MGVARQSYPRFRRAGGAPPLQLTQDDLDVLRHVYRHRFLRAEDLYRLLPYRSRDKLSRRLTWLFRNEFLDRPPAQVDRFGSGGSQSLVYGLATAGARTLKEKLGLPIGPTDWRARNRSYTRENLDHTLAVSRFLVDLELACGERSDLSLIRFEDILADAPEATRTSRFPGKWAVPVSWSNSRVEVMVAPDAIFGLRLVQADGKALRSYFFVEIDRGTMTIAPAERIRENDAFLYRATMLRKFLAYAESWRRKLHVEQFGIPTVRLLVLTTSAARAKAMRHAAEALVVAPQKLPGGLFIFGEQQLGVNSLVDARGTVHRL